MIGSREMHFMHRAVELSKKALSGNRGGPFGAIVVRKDEIIGNGYNQVISTNDPTAHAEILAIRDACRYLGSFELRECEIYSSCEPCPMCLGAIYWARMDRIYFANSREEAHAIGFDDRFIYDQLMRPLEERTIPLIRLVHPESLTIFAEWHQKENKAIY
ncbi:MAG TPA: nucleoside deaminase [Chitinophagaceae bacterium]|nr:nucleoside deaminase [Chitinophagaceae bacterium]